MTGERRAGAPPADTSREPGPRRTCLGCRRVRPQVQLLRLRRTPDGVVEPDPGRRAGGRGAYVCPSEACVREAVRRGRWSQVFRAPTTWRPETLDRLRALWTGGPAGDGMPEPCRPGEPGGPGGRSSAGRLARRGAPAASLVEGGG